MKIETLQDKFEHDLGDIYDAEHRFLEAHEQMMDELDDPQLKARLTQHVEETRTHIERIEKVFDLIDGRAHRIKCHAATGLVKEYHEAAKSATTDRDVLESVVATSMSKIEHYEMASYTSLITDARELGHTQAVELLRQTLSEEQMTSEVIDEESEEISRQART